MRKNTLLAMIQIEVDLVILTALLHFSGGMMNPFGLFYTFHVIIAAIILPRNLSISVGMSAIFLYGLMVEGEMQGWFWLSHYPLQALLEGGAWKDSMFMFWAFCAFVGMVVLAQYLTSTVITRIRKKKFV